MRTDARIEQAHRQIVFPAVKVDRDGVMASQLRSGQSSTRDFIRQLLRSETFQRAVYRCNSNDRVVEPVGGAMPWPGALRPGDLDRLSRGEVPPAAGPTSAAPGAN